MCQVWSQETFPRSWGPATKIGPLTSELCRPELREPPRTPPTHRARCPLSSWPTASSRTGCSLGSPPEVLTPSGPSSKLCRLPGNLFPGPSLVASFSPPEVFVCSFNVSADKLSAPSGQSSYLLPSQCTHGAQGFLSPAAQLTQNALG